MSSSLWGETMGHDQLFRTLLEKFLKDFLELFFPNMSERLDFEAVQFVVRSSPLILRGSGVFLRWRPGGQNTPSAR